MPTPPIPLPSVDGGRRAAIEVRATRPEEYDAVGALTAGVFRGEGWGQGGYLDVLRDVVGRAGQAQVLAALDGTRVVGAVAVATRGGPFAEQAAPGEAVVRMLVVDSAARGRGVGDALMAACLRAARQDGCRVVRLSTQPDMAAAHRLYGRLGFRRTPELDWRPEPDLQLWAYELVLQGERGEVTS